MVPFCSLDIVLNGFSASDKFELVDVMKCGDRTTLCLATAHALVRLDDGTIVGEPMEKTTLEALNWEILPGLSCLPFGSS